MLAYIVHSAYDQPASATINPESLASITTRFNLYCDKRAAAPIGVVTRPTAVEPPTYAQLSLPSMFPDVPPEALNQVCVHSYSCFDRSTYICY